MKPLCLHVFATFVPGGPQVRTARLIAAAGDAWRHHILAMDGQTTAADLLPAHVEWNLIDAPPRAGSLTTARRMRRLFAGEAADLILTYNWGAIDAALGARLPPGRKFLHHEDGFRPDEAQSYKRRREWFRRWILPSAAGVIVPSKTLERVALGRWKLERQKVHWIPNGIDVEGYSTHDGNPELRAALSIPEDVRLVGTVGHLRAEKRMDRLVEAMAGLTENTHLLIVGEGPARRAIEGSIAEHRLGDRVHLVGHVNDPRPYYAAMDLFALSSDTEQMPVALLEAMASRLAVVATDVGDVRSMLPGKQLQSVVPLSGAATPVSLGAAIGSLLAQGSLRDRLGEANRARVEEHYSFDAMLDAHLALWRSAIGLPSEIRTNSEGPAGADGGTC